MVKKSWKWILLAVVTACLAAIHAPWQLLATIAAIVLVAKGRQLVGFFEETALGERLTELDIKSRGVPSDDLVQRIYLSDHAVTRFVQRADLDHLSWEDARDLLRNLIGQEGRFGKRPAWERSMNPADGFLMIGYWLCLIMIEDGGRLTAVTTKVNDPDHYDPEEKCWSWADAYAEGWILTPPPVSMRSGEVDPRILMAATMPRGRRRLSLARQCGLTPSYERAAAAAREALLRNHGGLSTAEGRPRVAEPLAQLVTLAGAIGLLILLANIF